MKKFKDTLFDAYNHQDAREISLSVALLQKLGFAIPRHPLYQQPGTIIYEKINKIITHRWLGILPIKRSCRPIAISIINNEEIFVVYNPLPNFITSLGELLDYQRKR